MASVAFTAAVVQWMVHSATFDTRCVDPLQLLIISKPIMSADRTAVVVYHR